MHLNDWTTPICISAKSKIPDLHKSGMNDAEYIQQEVLCSEFMSGLWTKILGLPKKIICATNRKRLAMALEYSWVSFVLYQTFIQFILVELVKMVSLIIPVE